ncbi:NADH dehydrogenase subunit 6 (mitochondrion) [Chlamydomonas eustigma]|uniref:NADH-ubiquinone oxidoreductase chain 6 n=1 Tax=Chlamydomonas eustigma TaxID=1157962 RepID=A0A250XUL5_9CHLO|nr:NADH dehydrogenase subunit 6 [Chlamydomonas eustigma]|eukprot:GAX86702.1 NADH dehydrogenase subunit 6 (mitochondrion) [Chlamydomonas eustigma]
MTFYIILSCIFHNALLAIAVSYTRSPFQSLMYAVLLFINSSIILLSIGFEFLALINMLVYVGALAVLFLFVIMLLEIPNTELRSYNRGWTTLPLLPAIMAYVQQGLFYGLSNTYSIAGFIPTMESLTFVGHAFYIHYADILILNSLVLTVALFGALVLAHTA